MLRIEGRALQDMQTIQGTKYKRKVTRRNVGIEWIMHYNIGLEDQGKQSHINIQ